jgi:hypothetical protein
MASWRRRSFSLVAVAVARVLLLPACGTSDDDDARFTSPAPIEAGAGAGYDACADAFPPCAYYDPEAGAGTDLDASAETAQDGGSSCDYPSTCGSSTAGLKAVCGDQGSDSSTATGSSSTWLGVNANECDSGVRAASMKISATLDVPQGENFDLYMYMGDSSSGYTCSKLVRKSTGVGSATETVSIGWGESGFFANNSDDGRAIRFEVRHVSGSCSSTAKWKLTVYGNR